METLNKDSTEIFCGLIALLKEEKRIDFKIPALMDLYFERTEETFTTPLGDAKKYILAHSYRIGKKTFHSPYMSFIVTNNCTPELRAKNLAGIYPFIYTGHTDLSVCGLIMNQNKIDGCLPAVLRYHINYAAGWLSALQAKGWINEEMILRTKNK